MCAAAYKSRPSRWVARRTTDRDQVVGYPLARAPDRSAIRVLRTRSRCITRCQPSVTLRANEALQLTGARSIAVERLDTDTLIKVRRAWRGDRPQLNSSVSQRHSFREHTCTISTKPVGATVAC